MEKRCTCINVKVVDKYIFFGKFVSILCPDTCSVIEVYNVFVTLYPNVRIHIYNAIN